MKIGYVDTDNATRLSKYALGAKIVEVMCVEILSDLKLNCEVTFFVEQIQVSIKSSVYNYGFSFVILPYNYKLDELNRLLIKKISHGLFLVLKNKKMEEFYVNKERNTVTYVVNEMERIFNLKSMSEPYIFLNNKVTYVFETDSGIQFTVIHSMEGKADDPALVVREVYTKITDAWLDMIRRN